MKVQPMEKVDVTIIGAGVIGLSLARELSPVAEVLVLEQEPSAGRGVSSRSSEVIHAGIYYPTHFQKTALCVEGNPRLYEFCQRWDVPHRRIGKVIVAGDQAEISSLERLFAQGVANGVAGLRLIDRAELKVLEPNVHGIAALYSPATGIVDSHRLMQRLEALAMDAGAHFVYRTRLIGLDQDEQGFRVQVQQGPSTHRFASRLVINAAGLACDEVAGLAGIDPDRAGYRIYPVKGEYFRVPAGRARLVNGLVYPSPEKDLTGLGIHATKDLGGQMKLGPNAIYGDARDDFSVDCTHRQSFFEAVSALFPFLDLGDLEPDTAGIRPKIQALGAPARDFVIAHEAARGLPGMVNLIGMESPGLTASLAIAAQVKALLVQGGLLG